MPRGGPPSYTYSVPAGTQAIANASISSAAYNGFLSDLTTVLNGAWPVSGGGTGTTDGSVLAPNGAAGAPSVAFINDTTTGFYRVSSGDIGVAVLGSKVGDWTAHGISATNLSIATGKVLTVSNTLTLTGTDGSTVNLPTAISTPLQNTLPQNVGLTGTVAASALTVALKGVNGSDPSASNPVYIPFRNATAGTGTPVYRTVTAATSIVVASTKTLGTSSGVSFRIWVVAVDTGSGIELGVVNCLSGTSVIPLVPNVLYSPTATPGNSAQVIYTTSGQTNKPICILGYLDFSSGQVTAGTWATAPDVIQPFFPGMKLPGDIVQVQRNETGAVATGTGVIPSDDTIPQNTEGDQYMSQAITPSSATNLLRTSTQAILSNSGAPSLRMALFRDSIANAVSSVFASSGGSGQSNGVIIIHAELAGATTATTFKVRAGSNATITFNGQGGSRLFGGSQNSFMEVTEIMA